MSFSIEKWKSGYSDYQNQSSDLKKGALFDDFSVFENLGLPDRKNENWKYTNVNALVTENVTFTPAANFQPEESSLGFVFKDGVLANCPQNSQISWQSLGTGKLDISKLKQDFVQEDLEDGFEALSLTAPSDILYIEIPAKTVVLEPLKLIFEQINALEDLLSQPIVFIRVGQGSELHLFEEHLGKSQGLFNGQLNILLEDAARVHLASTINADENFRQILRKQVRQGRDSFFQATLFSRGGKLLRQSLTVSQMAPGAESICNGLYFTKDREHADFRVNLRHLMPHGSSRQLFKGVLKDASRAIFNGKIYIEKGAQKTDSSQLNHNLILSPRAEADSKPELEVYADDVKANHGSAIGQLDEDQLFYLMSRAIAREEAVKILARGFVEEVVIKMESKPLRKLALEWLESALVDFQQSLEQSKGFSE